MGVNNNIILRPSQPLESLSQSLSVPDIHIIPMKSGISGFAVPSKIYSLMAVGRPVIFCGESSATVSRLVASQNAGVALSAGDAAGLSEAILKLKNDAGLCREMGRNAKHTFDERFDRGQAMARWEAMITALDQNPGKAP